MPFYLGLQTRRATRCRRMEHCEAALTITLPDVSESAIKPAQETASNQGLLIEDDTGVRDLVVTLETFYPV